MGRLSRATWLYIGTVVAAAAVVLAVSPHQGISWSRLTVLAVLFLVCESLPTAIMPRRVAWSPGYAAGGVRGRPGELPVLHLLGTGPLRLALPFAVGVDEGIV